MKNITSLLLILSLFFTVAVARPAKRITFAKGATKAVVAGKFKGFRDSQVYLLKVRRNQTIKVSSSDSVTISIESPTGEDISDMDSSCNKNKTVTPTVAGTYRISVVECRKADPWHGRFKLRVSVR